MMVPAKNLFSNTTSVFDVFPQDIKKDWKAKVIKVAEVNIT